MADTFRDLCAELLRGLDENRHPEVSYPGHLRLVMASARAELAKADEPAVPEDREPASVTGRPSDEEVAELVAWLREEVEEYWRIGCDDSSCKLARVTELLQRGQAK